MENIAFDIHATGNNISDSKNEVDYNNKNMEDYKGYFVEVNNEGEDEEKYYEGGAHFPYWFLYERLKELEIELKEERKNDSLSLIDNSCMNHNKDNEANSKIEACPNHKNHALSRNIIKKKDKHIHGQCNIISQPVIAINKEQDINNNKGNDIHTPNNQSNPDQYFKHIILANELKINGNQQSQSILHQNKNDVTQPIKAKERHSQKNQSIFNLLMHSPAHIFKHQYSRKESNNHINNNHSNNTGKINIDFSPRVINQKSTNITRQSIQHKHNPLKLNSNNEEDINSNSHRLSTDSKGNYTHRYTAKCSQLNIHNSQQIQHHESFVLKKKGNNILIGRHLQAFSDEKQIKQKKMINDNLHEMVSSIGFEISNARRQMNQQNNNSNNHSHPKNNFHIKIKDKYNFFQYKVNRSYANQHQLHKAQLKMRDNQNRTNTLSNGNISMSRNYQVNNSNYKKFKTYLDSQLHLFQKHNTKLINEAKKSIEINALSSNGNNPNNSLCNIVINKHNNLHQSNRINTITDSTKANSLYNHPHQKEVMIYKNNNNSRSYSNSSKVITKKSSSNKVKKVIKRNESIIKDKIPMYFQSPIIIEKTTQKLIQTYKLDKAIVSPRNNTIIKSPISPITKPKIQIIISNQKSIHRNNNHNNLFNQHHNQSSKQNGIQLLK